MQGNRVTARITRHTLRCVLQPTMTLVFSPIEQFLLGRGFMVALLILCFFIAVWVAVAAVAFKKKLSIVTSVGGGFLASAILTPVAR